MFVYSIQATDPSTGKRSEFEFHSERALTEVDIKNLSVTIAQNLEVQGRAKSHCVVHFTLKGSDDAKLEGDGPNSIGVCAGTGEREAQAD